MEAKKEYIKRRHFYLLSCMVQKKLKETYLASLQEIFPDYEAHAEAIEGACDFAILAHAGQVRKYEAVPYVTHPMAVSLDVAQKYRDADMIIAALLHDTVEDCDDVTIEDIYMTRGDQVGLLVEAVTATPLFFVDVPEVLYQDKIEKLLAGGMRDMRVLLLKIADRDHNLMTLKGLKPNKQIRMTFETQAIYEPMRTILIGDTEWPIDLADMQLRFIAFLESGDIQTPMQLKHLLYSQMYHNFDDETYQLAYQNTDNIVRQIEDKARFESLLELENFKNHINVISLRTDGNHFKARFYFEQGVHMSAAPTGKYQVYNFLKK